MVNLTNLIGNMGALVGAAATKPKVTATGARLPTATVGTAKPTVQGTPTLPTASTPTQTPQGVISNMGGTVGNALASPQFGFGNLNTGNVQGEFGVPGAAENYWTQTQGQFSQPTTMDEMWKQYSGQFGAPTSQSDLWNQSQGMLNDPNSLAAMFAQFGGQFKQPTSSQTLYNQRSGQYQQPGQFENYAGGAANQMLQPGAMQQYQQGYQAPSGITDPGALQNLWSTLGSKMGGMTGSANQAQQAYQSFLNSQPKISNEPGFDTYYDTAIKRATEDLQMGSASRGSFGSSAAQGQERLAAEGLRGEQANREADYNLARLGEQRQWETLGGGLANQAQQAQQDWLSTLGGLAGGAETMDLNKTAEQRAWDTLGGNLANNAETLGLQRQQGAADIMNQSQNSALQRMLGGVTASSAADQNTLAKMMGGYQTAGNVDAGNLNQLNTAGNLAAGADSSTLEKLLGGFNTAQGVDATSLSQLLGGGNLSAVAQDAERQRGMDEFNKIFGTTQSINNTVGSANESMFGSDADLYAMIQSLLLGGTAEGAAQSNANQSAAMDLIKGLAGGAAMLI